MRLINFGAGEVCDRLTILALKILHGTVRGRDVAHWQKEQVVLLTKIAARNGSWFGHYTELAAVNASIWQGEDELRSHRVGSGGQPPTEVWPTLVQLGFRIQELNDQRAALIEAINKEAGDHLGSEKL
jgi:hypothetical protein